MSAPNKLKIGLSACLSGEAVRYDAGDKRQDLLISLLSPHAELRPFCPEVESGLGVPRPPVHLVQTATGRVRAQGVDDPGLDVTEALVETAKAYSGEQLEALDGFILKSRSPSCGLGTAPLTTDAGRCLGYREGLFAEEIKRAAPWLPAVEEAWLQTAERCYRFLSACAVTAWKRHNDRRHLGLVAWLESELGGTPTDEIVDALLGSSANEKATLWGRLQIYWQSRNSGA